MEFNDESIVVVVVVVAAAACPSHGNIDSQLVVHLVE